MDAEAWVRIALISVQIIVAIVGLFFVVQSIRQKTNSDNRAEWFRRFTWAIDHFNDIDPTVRKLSYTVLEQLVGDELATNTEIQLTPYLYTVVESVALQIVLDEITGTGSSKGMEDSRTAWDNKKDDTRGGDEE